MDETVCSDYSLELLDKKPKPCLLQHVDRHEASYHSILFAIDASCYLSSKLTHKLTSSASALSQHIHLGIEDQMDWCQTSHQQVIELATQTSNKMEYNLLKSGPWYYMPYRLYAHVNCSQSHRWSSQCVQQAC